MLSRIAQPFFIALAGLSISLSGLLAIPNFQDPGQQSTLFNAASITTTTQSVVVACPQGSGSVGRKTLSVHNGAGGGALTATVELRDAGVGANFTSGYLAVNNLAAGSSNSATVGPTAAGGAFCHVSVVSASTSTATVTLRRE
jgi:hypothetical protein